MQNPRVRQTNSAPNDESIETAWLDRRPSLAGTLLVLLPFVAHLPQVLLPAFSDPMHIFGALASPGPADALLAGHNFLDPYVGYLTQAVGRLTALDWLHGIVPWWNPYVGIGVPLAGEMQPSAFLLPFVLLLALPAGVVWLTIAMQILAGLGTYSLLRELRLGRLASLAGGALYALNGTIAWMPGPGAVVCTLAFLPILLWGIERCCRSDGGPAGMIGVAAGIGGSLVAGFPEVAYIDGLMGLAWAMLRCLSVPHWELAGIRVIMGGTFGAMLAAPVLIAFADLMAGSQLASQHLFGSGALLLRTLPLTLMPAIYGPINAGAAGDIMFGWGNVGGYSSALLLMLAIVSLVSRAPGRGVRLLLAGWATICLLKTFGWPPVTALVNLLPAMHEVAFYRYAAPSFELALVILAAYGLDWLGEASRRTIQAALLVTLVGVAGSALIAQGAALGRWSSLTPLRQAEFLDLSLFWTLFLVGLAYAAATLQRGVARQAIATLAVCEAAAMFCLPQLTGRSTTIDLAPVRFLQAHAGLARVLSIGPLAPNYGAYFGFAMLNHNMSPVPQSWVDYIATELLPGFGQTDEGAVFWPVGAAPLDVEGGIAALHRHLTNYQAMGVRYVVTYSHVSPLPTLLSTVAPGPNAPLALGPGQNVDMTFVPPVLAQPIAKLGVMLGTYGGASNGRLTLRLCAGTQCASGSAALNAMADNAMGFVTLDPPLVVPPGSAVQLRIEHDGGSNNVAVWTYPAAAGDGWAARLAVTGGTPRAVQLGVLEQGTDAGWSRVFTGSAADIWEIPNSLGYFDSEGCTLKADGRLAVDAQCARPSTLIRRELFLPGWQAQVNGHEAAVRPVARVLQEVSLPAGRSRTTFDFVPPYMVYGWIIAMLGALGIGTQLVRMRRTPQLSSPPIQ